MSESFKRLPYRVHGKQDGIRQSIHFIVLH